MKVGYLMAALLLLFACAKAPQVSEQEGIAVLAIHAGMATVNGSPATPGLELREGDVVRTSGRAKASIVFFDSAVLRLDENTEIMIKDMEADGSRRIGIRQSAGSTWSRVLKISGIREYSVETPNTVATVRGTGFAVKVSDGDSRIMVGEGEVHVASYEEDRMVAETVVTEDMEIEVTDEAPEVMEPEAMVSDAWIEENDALDEQFVDEVVEEYMEEHPEAVEELPEGLTEEQIEDRMEELVTGEIEEYEAPEVSDEVVENAPGEIIIEEAVDVADEPEEIREQIDVRSGNDISDELPDNIRTDMIETPTDTPIDTRDTTDTTYASDAAYVDTPSDYTANNYLSTSQ